MRRQPRVGDHQGVLGFDQKASMPEERDLHEWIPREFWRSRTKRQWSRKAGMGEQLRPLPPSASLRFNSGQKSRTVHGKGAGTAEIPAPDPSCEVGSTHPTYSVISRTLSHLKSTSEALSQRKVASGPPQVMGMASTEPPQLVELPPIWPESRVS
ncbi:hypothetical protein ATI61_1186 [Archangium gephyra]|uniref:Uncharacterized protein n=1 Tax=Archangium gephyra TaxID=48 RepID=A0ABX9JMW5_9BACT|nr:hypothetical protein ATI61_1186 [Archangium gephyra]